MSAIRRTGVFVVALAVALALDAGQGPHTAAGATKGSYSGSWSGSQTTEGMNGSGSGSISFTVDAEGGSFSCSFSGSGSFSGTRDGAKVTGRVTSMAGSGCSGSYDPKTGAVGGSMTINESLSWSWTSTYNGQTYSGSDSDSISLGASVSGNVKKGSGSVSYNGGNLTWRVSGSGGDLKQAVEFKDLSQAQKEAALEALISGIPEDKLLKMTDKELQAHIDKKFAELDESDLKRANKTLEDPKTAERVERSAQATEAKAAVNAAFESAPKDFTHEKLVKDIREMNDPYVREQAARQFVDNADKQIERVSAEIKQKKAPLEKETGFVDGVKEFVSGKLGNTEAGEAAVDGAMGVSKDYAVNKFENAIEDMETVKKVYGAGKSALEIKENIEGMQNAFKDLKDKSQKLKALREKGDITGQQADQIKALHIAGHLLGKVADYVPIKGTGEMVQSTFEAMTKPALVIATLGKTRDDLVNNPDMNLEGRKMHISEINEKPHVIERDDPTRPGQKIKYAFDKKSGEYHQIKEKKKEPDLYEWAKSLFRKKETPAHLKKYH
jgi:hypothetical protein